MVAGRPQALKPSARRATGRERQRRKRRQARPRPWRRLSRNQQEVARRLTAGQISQVTVSGWGFGARFLAFIEQLEYAALLEIEGQGFQRVMIPIARLLLTYQLKVLLGIPSMHLVPTRLFREVALLQLIGYTTAHLQAGVCRRGHLAHGPMHRDTLGPAQRGSSVERLTAEELEGVLTGAVQRLVARGVFARSSGHFALDASDLDTTARYQGAGKKTVTERKLVGKGKERRVADVTRLVYGFKVLIVYEVRLRLVVAAKVVPIQQHEARFTLELARQAIANLGPGVLRVLLIDRGFLDGLDLWTLKHELGIDFVIPAKADLRVTADARGLCRRLDPAVGILEQTRAGTKKVTKDGRERWPGQVTVVGVPALRSYDQYGTAEPAKQANRTSFVGNALNAVVVTIWEGTPYPVGDEKVFLTSLAVADPLAVLDLYDLRSLIENTAFRELKQGWGLKQYPKKTAAAVRGHVFLTLLTFTLTNAFRTAVGQTLAAHGIRRQRAEEHTAKIIVFADEHYAIFDIEEVFILLGVVPQQCWTTDPTRVRRKYSRPDAA